MVPEGATCCNFKSPQLKMDEQTEISMLIGILGINHKQADVGLREIIASAFQKHFALLHPLKSFVLLSTCNRCELYFSADDLALAHQSILAILREEIATDFEQKCYSFFGGDCFLHLAKVTAGLDSAILHETEIQGQVKRAYENATRTRALPKELHFLFQKSLKIAKEIRSAFPVPPSLPNLEHAIFSLAKHFFPTRFPPLLFVGVSEINCKIAGFLQQKGVNHMTFCTRTDAKAIDIANQFGGNCIPWQSLAEQWIQFPWVIAAANSSSYLLKEQCASANQLLVDLAVPRNIDPSIQGTLFNIDDLNAFLEERKTALHALAEKAETKIIMAVEQQITLNKESYTEAISRIGF
jgi:glutamyl-tRNA reductase